MAKLKINGKSYFVGNEPDTPLLWVLREDLKLTGTKFGCGGGYCGACTVHVNGEAMRSCRIRVGDVENAIQHCRWGEEIVVVAGSIFLVGAVKDIWEQRSDVALELVSDDKFDSR